MLKISNDIVLNLLNSSNRSSTYIKDFDRVDSILLGVSQQLAGLLSYMSPPGGVNHEMTVNWYNPFPHHGTPFFQFIFENAVRGVEM